MDIKNKAILVTGGAGFIGSNTAKALIKEGARVVIVDDLSTGFKENLPKEATFYEMNMNDPKIDEVFAKEKPDSVYHFAFHVQVPESVKNPLLEEDSLVGSLRLLVASRDHKVKKFIFASSGFIYGNNTNLPLKETEPALAVSPYAVSKYAIEQYLRFFHDAYSLPYVILRYPGVYGPGQVMGAMADYIRQLTDGKQAEIWGDGEKTRDYVFIDDVVRANVIARSIPDDHPDPTFNVGTGKETSLNELYTTIAKILKKNPKPIYHPDRPGEQLRYAIDATKFKKATDWKPHVTLEEGLRKRMEK